ncbi:MAG: outer membrane protein assembly factor BamA [Gemmatimonadaceae bacterium]|nr:outer membrane protein assembly factor BamA [Gemmatimonadaceae bacterium]
MSRKLFLLLALGLVAHRASAQDAAAQGRCTTPDSISVRGNKRVVTSDVLAEAGLIAGTQLNYKAVQRAIRALYQTGQFARVAVVCDLDDVRDFAVLTLDVSERPLLVETDVQGVERLSQRTVRDQIELDYNQPLDPAKLARAVHRIDSLYEKNGYYLARVAVDSTSIADDAIKLLFRIDEGRRLAVSGVQVAGNRAVKSGDIVGAMKTRPEGFFFWRRGEFDEDAYAGDLSERIPQLYAKRGFIDFRVARDTLLIDRDRGKALVDVGVEEGPRYKVGDFEVTGNKHFSSEDLARFYPFGDQTRPVMSRVTDFLRRRSPTPKGIFDEAAWEDAKQKISSAYATEGYIYANVRPVVERRVAPDSSHYVDLRWEVEERTPAVINRIEIFGNDYTHETCIRDQLVILPGQVFNQEALIRSWQSLGNLGFFETPIPSPDTRTANEQGDVDIVFRVKEKRTGNVNFGASMGQGTGVGGFIGLDQPNLFGQCKRGSLQWQFGRYINDFNLSYSDPRIRQSLISGTLSMYRSLQRYFIADLGRSLRTGAQLQFGVPLPRSPFTRVFLTYGAEDVTFGTQGLLGDFRSDGSNRSFRSTLGLSLARDTRIDLPFPTAGAQYNVAANFNGGVLGGTSSFQRYTADASAFAPLGQVGGSRPGSQPIKFVAGLTARTGAVFGNTGPFFFSQEFALGGVQFGERLRGYEEFSISPAGYVTGTSTFNAQRGSFGKAFFSTTAEVGMRLNQALYLAGFYDAGNVWNRPRDFDPTRLFRGAGISASTVTPLGPLGLDYAYGFDRLDAAGRKAPKWQLHFRLGQLF